MIHVRIISVRMRDFYSVEYLERFQRTYSLNRKRILHPQISEVNLEIEINKINNFYVTHWGKKAL